LSSIVQSMFDAMLNVLDAVFETVRNVRHCVLDFLWINRDFATNLATNTEPSTDAAAKVELVIRAHANMRVCFKACASPSLGMSGCTDAANIDTAVRRYLGTAKPPTLASSPSLPTCNEASPETPAEADTLPCAFAIPYCAEPCALALTPALKCASASRPFGPIVAAAFAFTPACASYEP